MIDKKEILRELRDKFEKAKKDLDFNLSFDELNNLFFLEDSILSIGFVAENFPRQIRFIIGNNFDKWISYLNDLLYPQSNSLTLQTEAKVFSSSDDKKLIWDLITKMMKLNSLGFFAELKNDKSLQKKFITESYDFWKKELSSLIRIIERTHESWSK